MATAPQPPSDLMIFAKAWPKPIVRITLVISSFGCGGSERVLSRLANGWAAKGWPVSILTFESGIQPCFPLHSDVIWRPLGIPQLSGTKLLCRRRFRQLRRLRDALRASRPDAIIAFVDRTNVCTLLASRGLDVPIVISDRISPNAWLIGPRGWPLLRRLTYPWATRLVVQTARSLDDYPPDLRERIRVIPNPAPTASPPAPQRPHPSFSAPHLLMAMGRLQREKGFDLLLEAFAAVASHHPDWSLVIWGDGEERAALEARRDDLGLRGHALLPGITHAPLQELVNADLFVLSSRFEGFPNVVCEALTCGTPVVSFDCPTGPAEIIRPGIDGILVPPENVNALAATLDRLMSCPNERRRLAQRGPEIRQRFSLDRVLALWEAAVTGS